MRNRFSIFTLTLALTAGLSSGLFTTELPDQNIKVLEPPQITVEPKIDGALDDDVWKSFLPLEDDLISFSPHFGDVLPQKTKIWLAYDSDNLYFGFYCFDPEPEKIKTSVSKRDQISADDWVGFSLDSVGNMQSAYNFYINPNGIQNDAYQSATDSYQSGEMEDLASDWVWYSAGRVVNDGYVVEVKVPLKSIRYKSGEDVEMGILFWRRISRSGLRGSYPAILPGKRAFECTTKIIYRKMNYQFRFEALPSVTYGNINDRVDSDSWGTPDVSKDLSLGLKYGVTSTVNAELAINPDFSQVESDEFQVVVNQRYPLFYTEKRPFFMETQSLFNIAGTYGTISMSTAVHTRKIIAPTWGGKLTGVMGRSSFGLLIAGDEWPGRKWEGSEVNPYENETAHFIVGRIKYGLGGGNYLGGIYSSRRFGDTLNMVLGSDLYFRLKEKHMLQANFLHSFTHEENQTYRTKGLEYSILYKYFVKPLELDFGVEHHDSDFRMDTAFYNRTGFTRMRGYISPRFYPNPEKFPWMRVIYPFVFSYYLHDTITNMDDFLILFNLTFIFKKQGYVRFFYEFLRESWAGVTFDQDQFMFRAASQLTRWLNLYTSFTTGSRIYYDPLNSFLGDKKTLLARATIQPSDKLTQYLDYYYELFSHDLNGGKIYEVHVLNSRTTYQFNKYYFIRAAVKYDSYLEVLLTDFLASFTLIPGTVIHLGYGSLYERSDWQQYQWVTGMGKMLEMKRSVFFKASYLLRF